MSESTCKQASSPDLVAKAAQQRRWLLWRAQKMTFWVLYDYAGGFVLLNLITLATVVLPAGVLVYLAADWFWVPLLAVAVSISLALVGQANLVIALLAEDEFSLRPVWQGIVQFGLGALGLGTVLLAGLGVFGLGTWFYWTQVAPARPWAGVALAALCGGSGSLVLLASLYWWPALVHQQGSAARAARVGFIVVARHPLLTLGLLAVTAGYSLVLSTPPGVLLLSTLPLVVVTCCTYELIARAYALDEALAKGEPAPAGTLDENDIFLNRGFTDLLHPWKA